MTSFDDEDEFLAKMASAAPAPAPVARTAGKTPTPAPVQRTGFVTEAFRAVAGGLRDAGMGAFQASDDVDDAVEEWTRASLGLKQGMRPLRSIRAAAMTSTLGVGTANQVARVTAKQADAFVPKIEENQNGFGAFSRDVVEFGAGFATGMKALKGLQVAGTVARMSRPLAAGAVTAFANVDPMQGNLANMAKKLGIPSNIITDALAVEEDDGAVEARLKNAASDAVTGVAFDAALKVLTVGVRQLRVLKNTKASLQEQASIPPEALQHPAQLDEQAAKAVSEMHPTAVDPKAPTASPAAPADALQSLNEDVGLGKQQALFAPEPQTAAKLTPEEELEQSLFDIPAKMEGLDEDALNALAKSFHEGGDYAVLERLGLNPARIDFGKVLGEGDASVARVSEIVERIAAAVQPIAMRAGSKPRTWDQTAMLANLIGSSKSQVVASFKGATNLLDAKAWAARQMLGGSAARLSNLATVARDFIDAPTSPQYIDFLKSLEAHAALQAQFKSATSNLGRALNSLKGTATASASVDKARRLRSLVPDAQIDDVGKTAINTAEDTLRALGDATTPAERKRLIDKIIKAKGNTEALTKIAERASGPNRWRRGLREFITGNLFSVGTASVNLISTAGHIGFRAMARLPAHGLAYALGKSGGKEAVAERIAESAWMHTIVPGFARGFTQVTRMLSDQFVEEAQGLAGSFGDNVAERGLGKLREYMDTKWGAYEPHSQRSDAERTKEWRVSKETIEAIMDNTDQLPALMRIGMRGMVGIGTGAFNLVGAASRSVRMLTIDMTDELLGSVVQQTTLASEAAKIAAGEGFERGLRGEELAKFVRQRADVLLTNSSDELLERAERLAALGSHEGSKEAADLAAEALRSMGIKDAAEAESRKVLFQDDLNWKISKDAARFLPNLDGGTGLIFPFIKTPLKILETTLGDYTPLGLLQKDLREKIMSGGTDATVAATQIALGTLAIGSAISMAAGGYAVGYDGGPRSSTRMSRPMYSVRVGGKWIEYSRFDPFGMLMGLGADMHEKVLNTQTDEGDAGPWQADRAAAGMMLAISRNILAKTWMTTMRDLTGAAGSQSDAQTEDLLGRLATSTIQKVVPIGGMIRWWEGTDSGVLREAQGMWEKVMQSTTWADELPVKRDTLLGRPVKYDRILGIQAGDDDNDPVIRELSDLSFDLPPNSKSFQGVELNSKQLARMKELTGQVVIGDSGMNLEGTLRELVVSSEWRDMDRQERIRAVRELRKDYHDLAITALRDEDRVFDHAAGSKKLERKLRREGLSQPEISAELQLFKQEVLGN